MIVSIHQPNFMPWVPFFQKIEESDLFIILENCQFEKNNFQNRFNINDDWYTMSVGKGLIPINKKKYVNPINDWNKIKNKLPTYKVVLDHFDDCISEDLSTTNIKIIKKICSILGITTKIIVDYPTHLKSTERLVHLCKSEGATHYLSGVGGKKYIDEKIFDKENIKLIYQDESKLDKRPILYKLSEL